MIKHNYESVEGGLCGDCVHAPTCTYLGSDRRRVFQCDEFLPVTPVEALRQAGNPTGNPGHNPGDNPAAAAAILNGRLGLCRSCAGWENCGYACPEGGVWHCDEYR